MILQSWDDLYETSFLPMSMTAAVIHYADGEFTEYRRQPRCGHLLHFMTDRTATRQYFLEDGSTFIAQPNDIVFMPDKSRYASLPKNGGNPLDGICVCFYLRDSEGNPIDIFCLPSIVGRMNALRISCAVEQMVSRSLLSPNDSIALAESFFTLLCAMRGNRPEEDEVLSPILRYMQENLETNLSIARLAAQFFMSEGQLRSLFEKRLGVLPKAYLLKLRLRSAEQYICSTSLPIADIAERLGFYDAAALTHAYRKVTGQSLSVLRRKEILT